MINRNDNLINKRFGRLLVTSYAYSVKEGRVWQCLCDCGNFTYALSKRLSNKTKSSCGCLALELKSKRIWKGHGEIPKNFLNNIINNAKKEKYFY